MIMILKEKLAPSKSPPPFGGETLKSIMIQLGF